MAKTKRDIENDERLLLINLRKCSRCGEEKSLSTEFCREKRAKSGLCSQCKSCDKLYRQTHREQREKYRKAYYQSHREESREYDHAHSEQRREAARKYYDAHPEKVKKRAKEYRLAYPEKTREACREWRLEYPEKNKKANREWRLEHPEEIKMSIKKWRHTPEGKASSRKRDAIRKQFSFIPLNKYFEDSESHHIDKEQVIYIPKMLHRSIWHSILQDINMEVINTVAFNFLKDNESRASY